VRGRKGGRESEGRENEGEGEGEYHREKDNQWDM
jgi:hypothetical protein